MENNNVGSIEKKYLAIAFSAMLIAFMAMAVVNDRASGIQIGGGGGGGSTTTLPADNITLADENNYYTSDNVEGALKQLYELAAENGSLVVTTTDQTANRAIDGTPYQNGDNLRICVVGFSGDAGTVEGYIGASSPPTITVAHDAFYVTGAIQLIVPPNYFYAVWGEYGGQGLNYWYEMEISGGGGGTGGDYTADIENLRDVLDNQIIRIDNLIDVCDNYGGDLDNYREQIDNLRAVADNLKTRIDNCQTHVDNLRTNVDNVRTVVDNLRGAADNLKTRVDNYQTHIDNLRATCDNFKAENTRIWAAINGDNAIHIADNTATWAAITGDNTAHNADNANIKTRLDNLTTHMDNVRAVCDNLKAENTLIWTAINSMPTGTIAALVAAIDLSRTMTNIGATYKDIYSTAFDGEMSPINFTNATQFRILFMWDYVGSGTQTVWWVDAADNTNILWTSNGVSADQDPGDSGWVDIPAAFVDAEKWIEWQGKSTTAADDPIAKGYRIYLR
jgi:FtsZ-binding cell division protein ZapB